MRDRITGNRKKHRWNKYQIWDWSYGGQWEKFGAKHQFNIKIAIVWNPPNCLVGQIQTGQMMETSQSSGLNLQTDLMIGVRMGVDGEVVAPVQPGQTEAGEGGPVECVMYWSSKQGHESTIFAIWCLLSSLDICFPTRLSLKEGHILSTSARKSPQYYRYRMHFSVQL